MSYTIGIVHATENGRAPIETALLNHYPQIEAHHFTDDELLQDVTNAKKVTKTFLRRLIHQIEKAAETGVDGVALSCSSFTPYVDLIQELFDFPIESVDLGMLEAAVTSGKRIGVLATLSTAGKTTTEILRQIADQQQKEIHIHTEVLEEAAIALKQGKASQFDQMIQEKIVEISPKIDIIVIAQLSMTRALNSDLSIGKPILSSAEFCLSSLVSKLEDQQKEDIRN